MLTKNVDDDNRPSSQAPRRRERARNCRYGPVKTSRCGVGCYVPDTLEVRSKEGTAAFRPCHNNASLLCVFLKPKVDNLFQPFVVASCVVIDSTARTKPPSQHVGGGHFGAQLIAWYESPHSIETPTNISIGTVALRCAEAQATEAQERPILSKCR